MIAAPVMGRVRLDLDQWEVPKLWMYLDSEGLITVGCGIQLATAEDAAHIAFDVLGTSRKATVDEIKAEWTALHAGSSVQKSADNKKKHTANYYKDKTTLRISKAVSDTLRDQHIAKDYVQLRSMYTKFDSFPWQAQVALFDMAYNLGTGHSETKKHKATGLRKYSSMNRAIAVSDWRAAAASCLRHGIPAERNRMTKALFLACPIETSFFRQGAGILA
jgi:GH24 family phage-related lysozyme (muramidase)